MTFSVSESWPNLPHVIEHLLRGPLVAHADEVGRHQAADAALRVIEELLGNLALLGRKQRQHLRNGRARQLFQERGAVVGRHLIEDAGRLLGAEGLEHPLLLLGREVTHHFGGLRLRQQPEDDRLLVGRHIGDARMEMRDRSGTALADRRPLKYRKAMRAESATLMPENQ